MGRQFRFYILPSDANALADRLRTRFGAKVLVDYSPEYELFEVDMPFRENSTGSLEALSSLNRFYLAQQSGQLTRNYCPKPNWWVIDSDSEGIEFSGCAFDGITLLVGRLWYQTDFVRNLQLVSKSIGFVKWAESVYRFTKTFLHYEREIDAYVGEDALKFHQSGGLFASSIRSDGKVIPA
jgi:hypothetical protein